MARCRLVAALAIVACATIAGARSSAALYRLDDAACPAGFGTSIAVLGDALLVSGGCGRVDVFDAARGTPRGELVASDSVSRLGGALAADADTIAVTAANTCTIHLFEPSGAPRLVIRTDGLVESDECFFGASLAAGGGHVAVVGAEAGVLLFDASTGTFVRAISPPGGVEEAGPRVALVGPTLFVGVAGFARYTDGPSRVLAFDGATGRRRWTRGAPGGSKLFGSAVAADGRSLVVGFWRDARDRESVALLDARTGRLHRVYRSPRRRSDFGLALAVRGDRVLIGAPDFEHGRGRAYLFARRSGARLATYRPGASGSAVALGHQIVAVGAPRDGAGSVSVFAAPVE